MIDPTAEVGAGTAVQLVMNAEDGASAGVTHAYAAQIIREYAVEQAGVFGGYLEDLVYTPKSLKAVKAVRLKVPGSLGATALTWMSSTLASAFKIGTAFVLIRSRKP